MKKLLFATALTLLSNQSFAADPVIAPQAASCIATSFSNTGTSSWKTINLKVTNNCGTGVDFRNTTITFLNASKLTTSFWGSFSPLSYPTNNLQITSQLQSSGKYLSTLYLSIPTGSGYNSILPAGKSITIIYGAAKADYVSGSAVVYTGSTPATGEIDLANSSARPTNVSQTYALVHLTYNGSPISDVQVPWSSTLKMPNLATGTYVVSPVNVTDSSGNVYQGVANPATLSLTSGQILTSGISYTKVAATGKIAFKVQALPSQLTGYTSNPAVVLKNTSNSSTTNATAPWNVTTTVQQLASGVTYSFTSPIISYNGYNCAPTFTPVSAVAASTAPIVNLTYACTQVVQDTVTINVSGLTSATSSIGVTFTPNNGSTPATQTVALTNGAGTAKVQLTDGLIYTVSSTSMTGYTVAYSPQPLTAQATSTETITYAPVTATGGRIIGYLPGWVTPPSASTMASAGYTHMMVSFGVFSTSTPGKIVPAFETISASYISSLHNAGIKVLLSLGGASTSVSGTTINFHQALAAASSQSTFISTFIASMESLITQYGFDGFDFDIESGLNAGGTFTTPQGDIAVLASIINTMHANHPTTMLTLAPQTANVAATSSFDAIWGNYASLVMQTYKSLEWVGIQNYNSGCMLGINNVCYDPGKTSSPDFSVVMAVDLLANWPSSYGFQPYVSYLNPSQIVLGYLSANSAGQGDGTPVIPVSTIKRAIQCLRTGVKGTNSCDTYVPPKAYPGIGGVFDWDTEFDASNNFQFAKGLTACVKQGTC